MTESIKGGDWIYPGTTVLKDQNGNALPDTVIIEGSGTRTYEVITLDTKTLFVDVLADQDCTVVITPLLGGVDGVAGDTLSQTADEGARGSYTDIAAPRAKIVVTNSSASDMTSYFFTVRGSVR